MQEVEDGLGGLPEHPRRKSPARASFSDSGRLSNTLTGVGGRRKSVRNRARRDDVFVGPSVGRTRGNPTKDSLVVEPFQALRGRGHAARRSQERDISNTEGYDPFGSAFHDLQDGERDATIPWPLTPTKFCDRDPLGEFLHHGGIKSFTAYWFLCSPSCNSPNRIVWDRGGTPDAIDLLEGIEDGVFSQPLPTEPACDLHK